MKIDFVRSGGIGGFRLALVFDTETLPAEEASRIAQLVEGSGFFDLHEGSAGRTPAPDRFEYRLAIQSQVWGHHAVVLHESGVPDEMRPLLDLLTGMAMRGARRGDPSS